MKMKSTQVRIGVPRPIASVVQISTLYAQARRTARRRVVDGWLAVATAVVVSTFIAAFAWYVLNPAIATLVGR